MYFDPSYFIFIGPAMILMFIAQWYVKSSYKNWSRVRASSQQTGAQAAEALMRSNGLYGVEIEGVRGSMTDHYDPRAKILRLSEGVYGSNSVAALAIAAHEMGHAMQDKEKYPLLGLRTALVPPVNFGSRYGVWMIIIGFLLSNWGMGPIGIGLAWVGVALFSLSAIFSLVTLPVELDASARAKKMLANTGLITSAQEQKGVNQVLNAAALTYVAALLVAVMQVLYYVMRLSRR